MNSGGIVLNFVQLNANFVKYLTIKFIFYFQAPPEVRSSSVDRAGARMAAQLRNPPYPLYPG